MWQVLCKFAQHPVLQDQTFLILPDTLLRAVQPVLRRETLSTELWKLERELGLLADNSGSIAGIRNFQPVYFDLFPWGRPQLPMIDVALLREMGWDKELNVAMVKNSLESIDIVDRLQQQRRAYAGWLMTQAAFVVEHDELCAHWRTLINSYGFPASAVVSGRGQVSGAEAASDELAAFFTSCERFYRRWQLAGMAAPGLPIPYSPQMPAAVPMAHADEAMQTFSWPRTLPLPPGDTLQQWIDQALPREPVPHLDEWFTIIRRDNPAKQTLTRYARIFLLQHCWRILHERHPEGCRERKDRLTHAFADFLQVSYETVKVDLRFIVSALGPSWHPM